MDLSKIFSEQALSAIENSAKNYQNNSSPFPHISIDNFFRPEVAEYLYKNFPGMDEMPNIFREPMSYKGQLSDIDGKWPIFSEVFRALQSDEFRGYLSVLTGIPGLLPDKLLAGGGLHQSPKSGFLDIHVDANYHPLDKSLHRRVNIIIYINKNWDSRWGGDLQLWTDDGNKPGLLKSCISPLYNRAAIFSTTRTSWHGVSPVTCPDNQSRKSLALYYYTKTRPLEEQYADSSVIWMSKTNVFKRVLYPVLNFVIKLLKPYAKYIRRNVFDASKEK
jgi:hypothetical protein